MRWLYLSPAVDGFWSVTCCLWGGWWTLEGASGFAAVPRCCGAGWGWGLWSGPDSSSLWSSCSTPATCPWHLTAFKRRRASSGFCIPLCFLGQVRPSALQVSLQLRSLPCTGKVLRKAGGAARRKARVVACGLVRGQLCHLQCWESNSRWCEFKKER